MYNIENEQVRHDIVKIQQAFLTKVYGWMMLGLLVTALSSFFTITNESLLRFVFSSKITFFAVIIAQVGIVIYLSARIQKMSAAMAKALFILYSAITGITLASIFLVYTAESIGSTFIIAALMFGSMAFYGYITKRDLTGVGQFMMMGLIGVVIASVVNIFMGSNYFRCRIYRTYRLRYAKNESHGLCDAGWRRNSSKRRNHRRIAIIS